jgi:hypothetical protein
MVATFSSETSVSLLAFRGLQAANSEAISICMTTEVKTSIRAIIVLIYNKSDKIGFAVIEACRCYQCRTEFRPYPDEATANRQSGSTTLIHCIVSWELSTAGYSLSLGNP